MNCLSCLIKEKASQELGVPFDEGIENVRIYSYKELKQATQGFHDFNKIGKGGFGSVYKGKLKNEAVVAIKVLSSESKQGVQEFVSELKTIANVVHENLVELYGCCVEGNHRILVYKYLANNSLAHTLLSKRSSNIRLNWRVRAGICIGIARGLSFLHEEIKPHIVHRDIKASNILLDDDLTPKISDFGLAKLFPPNMTHVSTRVAGTMGYLAPEYAISGKLTRKADVYSFGVLLLEVISGRCNTNKRLPVGDQFLLVTVWNLHERDDLLSIVDAELDGDFNPEEAHRFLKVGLLCTQDSPRLRPAMSAVVQMLTGKKDVSLETIKPGFISDFGTSR
ncbi:unnamed protein product [Spirodela intermedia]|uniref:Protein kinase domain-containing protein n=1 Tax=Spirodela intermedia TaxID=51605 RepID=A0A7I8JFR0_SPIIN|nr:unnamed protein product [Spirodela intermedia]CAA6668565.1 unnamed protein product [Spirodela intermedia]